MPYFKDSSNNLHFLESVQFAGVLPAGCVPISDADAATLQAPQQAQLILRFESALQDALDAGARSWGYDDIKTAIGYVGDPHAQFDAEAKALRGWRSTTWVWAAAELAQIKAGSKAMPASVTAFVAGMPALPTRP